jgi:hypothetical protein
MERALRQPLLVEMGAGELLDKITILRIKCLRFRDVGKRRHVAAELEALSAVWQRVVGEPADAAPGFAALQALNERLWEVEDSLRACERAGDFGSRFIALARSVYQLNDDRAQHKRRINAWYGSAWVEEKEYAAGDSAPPPPSAEVCGDQ